MSSGKRTTDHATIRKWAEARGGRPARVRATANDESVGIVRLDFGQPEESLEEISWDDFFRAFEESRLALIYQEKTDDGRQSRFAKLVHRDSDDG